MKKLLIVAFLFVLANFASAQTFKNCVPVKHTGWTAEFDTVQKYPVLVQWWCTPSRVKCKDQLSRKDCFAPDPDYKRVTNLANSYKGTGLDRGHMCPAADNLCDPKLAVECFYFSNMAPQYHSLNAGDWKSLETAVRNLAASGDSVEVWCGSVGNAKVVNGLTIPTKCWKVTYDAKTKVWSYYVFNNTANKPIGLKNCMSTQKEVESLTGFTFKP